MYLIHNYFYEISLSLDRYIAHDPNLQVIHSKKSKEIVVLSTFGRQTSRSAHLVFLWLMVVDLISSRGSREIASSVYDSIGLYTISERAVGIFNKVRFSRILHGLNEFPLRLRSRNLFKLTCKESPLKIYIRAKTLK